MKSSTYIISCHCGTAAQTVQGQPRTLDVCHCKACRHSTGLLCVSYMPLTAEPRLAGLKAYDSSPRLRRFFCGTCGCHVFRRCQRIAGDEAALEWAVATGVISQRVEENEDGGGSGGEAERASEPQYTRHVNVADTRDGGLSPWLPRWNGAGKEIEDSDDTLDTEGDGANTEAHVEQQETHQDILKAACCCGTVKFHITRPNAASQHPRSNYPDLIVPYHTASPRIANPDDDKWWLVTTSNSQEATRYRAGTCACRSCRLTPGFEIQTWAFVPRANIHIQPPPPRAAGDAIPLDFPRLPRGLLQSYASSEGVRRESCPRCGATVFWHDAGRPDLVDVSAGLLDAAEGARAAAWLRWWRDRVSFAEDAGNGRRGVVRARAEALIERLGEGMRRRA